MPIAVYHLSAVADIFFHILILSHKNDFITVDGDGFCAGCAGFTVYTFALCNTRLAFCARHRTPAKSSNEKQLIIMI